MATAAPTPEATDPGPARRWYRLTPGRVLVGLLIAEGLLWLSGQFQWFAFNRYKGWTVLIALGAVAATLAGLLVWFAASLLLRLRFQFSVRSLLVLMTAVAVACSWLAVEMQRAERQRNAVEAIARDSRDVWYDYQVDTPPCLMNKRAKPPAPAWLRHVLGDDFFCDTAVVNWCVKPMDDATLVYIKELTALRFLYLNYGEATDAGLGNLKALTQLETLELPGTVVGDAGLEHLKGLTALQHLDLSETEISDAGLVHLKGLTRLRELWLADTRISDVGLEHLYGLSELTQLDLRGTRVTGAGIQKLHRALPQCLIGE